MTEKPSRKLRSGFTTGTAAAASAKASVMLFMTGKAPDSVDVRLPGGEKLKISIRECRFVGAKAECTVIKDAGDDPDVTNKAVIGARVWKDNSVREKGGVFISAGEGVGMVTKPGLELDVGEPAINPVPRDMIRWAVQDALASIRGEKGKAFCVEIFVPRGVKLAEKTMNARLGIVEGISILGTTGVVRPLSHEAYKATITAALSVARAAGLYELVLTTGRRSERFAQAFRTKSPQEAFVQIGDYFAYSMNAARAEGFEKILLAVFFGKAVKIAQGLHYTHAAKSRIDMESLAELALKATNENPLAKKIRNANTARQALGFVRDDYRVVLSAVGERMIRSARDLAGPHCKVDGLIFDYNSEVLFNSTHQIMP